METTNSHCARCRFGCAPNEEDIQCAKPNQTQQQMIWAMMMEFAEEIPPCYE